VSAPVHLQVAVRKPLLRCGFPLPSGVTLPTTGQSLLGDIVGPLSSPGLGRSPLSSAPYVNVKMMGLAAPLHLSLSFEVGESSSGVDSKWVACFPRAEIDARFCYQTLGSPTRGMRRVFVEFMAQDDEEQSFVLFNEFFTYQKKKKRLMKSSVKRF